MPQAPRYEILDDEGNPIRPRIRDLDRIASMPMSFIMPIL